ncbi:hypothetical protein [Spirosoma sp.]|uniref:hypothetical protein n=1 Tax=Spirosoma sp. TaxID=1899569 RepID=UPI003B3AE4C6
MKNNIERFVRDNREDFDDKEPSAKLWEKIEAGLQGPGLDKTDITSQLPDRKMPFQQIHRNNSQMGGRQIGWPNLDWRVAASIAVFLLLGGFLYMNREYGVTRQPEIMAASPTYAKEVVQYTRLIEAKRTELKQMTEGNPDLYKEFATDLDRLENSYRSLKADLPQNPNQEVLIQAMIQNLQLQINLLNEQLRVIQRIKQQTHESSPV